VDLTTNIGGVKSIHRGAHNVNSRTHDISCFLSNNNV
jgi:hypothetical protein